MSAINPPVGRSKIRIAVSFILFLVIIFVLSRTVEWPRLWESFKSIKTSPILLLSVVHLANVLLLSPLIWRVILRYLNCRPSMRETLEVWIGMACLRSFMPVKSGEIVGANFLRIHHDLPLSKGAGSLILLHFLNFFSLWFYFALGMFLARPDHRILASFFLGGLLCVPVALPYFGRLARIGHRIHPRLGDILTNLAQAFTDIPIKPRIGIFISVLCIQSLDIIVFGLGFSAVGMPIPIKELVYGVPLVYLLANLPITPMGVGTREATMLVVFGSFGTTETILVIGIVLSFCLEILPVIISLTALPRALSLGLFKR